MSHFILNGLPEPARAILTWYADEILDLFAEQVVGIYITGSMVQDDFIPVKSDIDFLTILHHGADEKQRDALVSIHRAIQSRYPKPDLSGTYLTAAQVESDKPEDVQVWSWHERLWKKNRFEMAPVSLLELATHAIAVSGPPGQTWKVRIDTRRLRHFMLENHLAYWQPWINQHSRWRSKKGLLFLFPRMTEWSVLGIARQWYTLRTGRIVSKYKAGEYVMEWLPAIHHPILRMALQIRRDQRTIPLFRSYTIEPSFARMNKTIDCLAYMTDRMHRSKATGFE